VKDERKEMELSDESGTNKKNIFENPFIKNIMMLKRNAIRSRKVEPYHARFFCKGVVGEPSC